MPFVLLLSKTDESVELAHQVATWFAVLVIAYGILLYAGFSAYSELANLLHGQVLMTV